ncbi:MAG: phosphatase PAP2 family protein [Candidatus Pseudobacter hemicellulosilyticus]|uniref:Phosphatase PAP2 family protein n=1 Tax=Candidatus Pseudobacter hemicellulosilyticus TaxID=3121375 RepID=A0AAJ5WTD2_9BACT|nr:MAG: phosphatase PAP2 family protein [Pseudobacter sp.]
MAYHKNHYPFFLCCLLLLGCISAAAQDSLPASRVWTDNLPACPQQPDTLPEQPAFPDTIPARQEALPADTLPSTMDTLSVSQLPENAMPSHMLVKATATDTAAPLRYKLNLDYVKSFWPSLKYTVSRPAHWNKKDWTKFSVAMVGVGGLMLADWEIRHVMQANQHSIPGEVAKVIEPFGNFYGVYIFPTMYLAGALTKNSKFETAGLVGAKSLAISTLIYTTSKTIIRRKRPDEATSSWDYAPPFSGNRYTSSPSGHSNTIFSVATALAMEFRDTKWVPPVAYALATATAASRIYQNRHWASDVLLGSLIGHFVTRAVWISSHKPAPKKIVIP